VEGLLAQPDIICSFAQTTGMNGSALLAHKLGNILYCAGAFSRSLPNRTFDLAWRYHSYLAASHANLSSTRKTPRRIQDCPHTG